MNITNLGGDPDVWLVFIKILIVGAFIYWCWKGVQPLLKKGTKNNFKKMRSLMIRLILLIAVIIFLFASFGSKPSTYLTEDSEISGRMEQISNMPTETKTDKEVKLEAEKKKPDVLKRQETSDFSKEQKEAEDYLNKLLKN